MSVNVAGTDTVLIRVAFSASGALVANVTGHDTAMVSGLIDAVTLGLVTDPALRSITAAREIKSITHDMTLRSITAAREIKSITHDLTIGAI